MFGKKWSPVVNEQRPHRVKPSNPKYLFMALIIFPFVTVGLPKFYTHMQHRRDHHARMEEDNKQRELEAEVGQANEEEQRRDE